jgi:dienelactone hydrolase
MTVKRYVGVACTALIFSMTAVAGVVDTNLPAISYISFESPDLSPNDPLKICYPNDSLGIDLLTISGQLRIPTIDSEAKVNDLAQERIPAVVVLHGSAGLDSRGSLYVEALNEAGIATLEIDMWAPRGLTGGADRPAFPTVNSPDAFSALNYLAERPEIDPDRIGLIGFSWGGVVTMLAATNPYTDCYGKGRTFAAYVAHYPVCWAYNIPLPFSPGLDFEDLTGNPLLIQIGDRDDYDDGPGPCKALAAPFANVSVNVYKNSYHAWDRLQPAITVTDPFSHQGAGGEVEIVPSPGKAFQSRSNVVRFFKAELGTE